MSENVIHCGKCGYANSPNDDYCIKCGNYLSKQKVVQENLDFEIEKHNTFVNVCPVCQNIDQMQKLITIVSMGIHTTSGSKITSGQTRINGKRQYYSKENGYLGNSTLSGLTISTSTSFINLTESSVLTKKLSPPQEPARPQQKVFKYEFIFSLLALIIGFFAFYATIPLSEFFDSIIGFPTVLWFFIGIVAGIFTVKISYTILRNMFIKPHQEKLDREFSIIESKYKKEFIMWEKAMARWNSMYYCYRDNVVFIPGESETVPPEYLFDFCYKF